jgi:hypothetical protein
VQPAKAVEADRLSANAAPAKVQLPRRGIALLLGYIPSPREKTESRKEAPALPKT